MLLRNVTTKEKILQTLMRIFRDISERDLDLRFTISHTQDRITDDYLMTIVNFPAPILILITFYLIFIFFPNNA